jgi:hypothetical protein
MMNLKNRTVRALSINPATRIIVSVAGILCGISDLEHGFFETLQSSAFQNSAADQPIIVAEVAIVQATLVRFEVAHHLAEYLCSKLIYEPMFFSSMPVLLREQVS